MLCAGNLKQVALGLNSYIADYNGNFCPHLMPGNIWWNSTDESGFFANDYLSMKEDYSKPGSLLDCPSNDSFWLENVAGKKYMNYAYNLMPYRCPFGSWSLAYKVKASKFKAGQLVMFADWIRYDGESSEPDIGMWKYGYCSNWNNTSTSTTANSGIW